jgi:hypothetical protein
MAYFLCNNGSTSPSPSSDWDYYFENITCLESSPESTIINLHGTNSIFKSSEVRDWEAIINFENRQTDTSERSPFGINEGPGYPALEIYVKGQTSDTFIYHRYIDGTSKQHDDIIYTGNLNNTDIIFRKIGGNLNILVNNSVALTIPFVINRDSNTENATLGCYYGYHDYYFEGIINKFGFRWLS